ncbi:hypothetical protein, partial [Rhodococcus rhodochrous]|uniref:hypothetical protein n=1 Tax=Rhodococcus rhodochrous TaxID=1829 RepID=UPI003FD1C581
GLPLFVWGDNLRKGAALNTIQIVECLVEATSDFLDGGGGPFLGPPAPSRFGDGPGCSGNIYKQSGLFVDLPLRCEA